MASAAAMAIVAPTETSIPPAMSTIVWPKTSGASREIWRATFSRLLNVRKYSPADSANVAKSATTMIAAVCCPPIERSRLMTRIPSGVTEDAVGPNDGKEHQSLRDLLAFDRHAEKDQQIVQDPQ